MSKRLILVLALAFVVGIAVTAYAEVQNVKVSGDILLRAISRRYFGLSDYEYNYSGNQKYDVAGFTSTVRLRVDADLTDNVSTTVRLLNERSWGEEYVDDEGSINDIAVDLAYVTLKEFLYSPLTLILGRQELRFGNGLIIGDPDTNMLSANWYIPLDLSARKSFDAVRATLNYDPLVVDLIYSKITETDGWWWYTGGPEDIDVNLYGINARYDLNGLGIKGTGELYFFSRVNKIPVHYMTGYYATVGKKDTCNVVGTLISGEILKDLTGSLEYAYQFGKVATDPTWLNTESDLKRRAWAIQVALNYALPIMEDKAPNVGIVYTRLSGDKTDNKKYKFWDPMFEDQTPNSIPNAIFSATNCEVINAKASMKPMEDVTLSAIYGYYHLVKHMDATDMPSLYGSYYDYFRGDSWYDMTDKRDLGHALDIIATYDYTEDVQFGLLFGYFNPGSALDKEWDVQRNATQVIGSMKVTF